MRETRKSNTQSQQSLLIEKKVDVFQQIVEHEYTKLFRETYKAARKAARHLLRDVPQLPPPSPLANPIPISVIESTTKIDDDLRTLSVTISDGTNQKLQKHTTVATIMPSLISIRELISYVPTMKNIATRGDLTGIPYLGDQFDRDDQELIDSISGEASKQNRNILRKNKLDDNQLKILYDSLRSNETWKTYTNDQIVDAIINYHRDSTSRSRLLAYANQCPLSTDDIQQQSPNIDTCDTIDADIHSLVIKSWCSRFCIRCYTYNCLLHSEKYSHLPLPKQFFVSQDNQSTPCGSTCYKQEREHLKRALSPSSLTYEQHHNSSGDDCARKRQRKSVSSWNSSSPSNKLVSSYDENCNHSGTHHKKVSSPHLLTRIENYFKTSHSKSPARELRQSQYQVTVNNKWTLTDRSLFRLFYFALDGDLCLLKDLFHYNQRTCYDIYQQFIADAQYFSDHTSSKHNLKFSIRQPYRRKMLEGATRAFLFHIKRHMNPNHESNGNNQKSTRLKPAFQPCLHDGPCTSSNHNCSCMKNGTFCEKFCNCSIDCPHRFPGCTCKGACLLNNCLCCAEGRECDPDLCHKCGASLFSNANADSNPTIKSEPEAMTIATTSTTATSESIENKTSPSSSSRKNTRTKFNENIPTRHHSLRTCRTLEPSYKAIRSQAKRSNSKTSLHTNTTMTTSLITCANIGLQRKSYKQILIAESDVAGYGAFLGSPVAYPGDLIAEYTGEIISEEEADRRGRLYDKQACSYLFNLDTQRCVDARQFGNKIRFANHSSKPNCIPKIKLVNGDYRIGIYAKHTIFQGDELFFEYMYDAHHRQQFVNNERIDELEQEGLIILKRFADNLVLVRPSYD